MTIDKWKPVKGQIMTGWARNVDPDNVLAEYPRPQLRREEWLNLNGLWDYAIVKKKVNRVDSYQGKILVPFPVESALSGVNKKISHKERIWYRRNFRIPSNWAFKDKSKRILLNFGAVDYHCIIWINGIRIGEHKGGYTPFSFDISESVSQQKDNEIIVAVWDPTDKKGYPRGKQKLRGYGIWYTPSSGIWQTIWIEPVPEKHITSLKMETDIDENTLFLKVNTDRKSNDEIKVIVKEKGDKIEEIVNNNGDDLIAIKINNPTLWSPENPFLYDLEISLAGKDKVSSYFGMRKISLKMDKDGHNRLALNNEILFQFGPLDQGFWPDGLHSAPTDEALKYDIEITKRMGFNMIRKHIKIEPARWYYHCDKLGVLVWQDMVSGGKTGLYKIIYGFLKKKKDTFEYKRKKEERDAYYYELEEMISNNYNHPSIIMWVPFNEGWGQFKTKETVEFVKNLDKTRLINAASGWFDHKVGDIADCHKYVGPCFPENVGERSPVCGEFGGLGLKIENHIWKKRLKFVYKKLGDRQELLKEYKELMVKLKKLKQKGLSAAVYTQTTDVEGEINGLLTYERKVLKIDEKSLKKINQSIIQD